VSARVVEMTAEQTHDLRRRVLRVNVPTTEVHFPEDDRPDTFHLGVEADGAIVVTSTWSADPCPLRPGARAIRLRGMATEPGLQGAGYGRLLLAAATERARAAGFTVAWATARDSALGFYARCGFATEGEGFVHEETQLPHHVVVYELRPS
jgi:GNAT superfamily N-acetyltransferase